LGVLVQKLEDKIVAAKTKQSPVIDIEKNENLRGLEFIEVIFRAIRKKLALEIWYQSFKAKRPGKILFHPYLLKEYRNRWFVIGSKAGEQAIINLALDRIKDIDISKETTYYQNPDFDPATYYENVIGVTVTGMRPMNVHLLFEPEHAPYVLTKPLHHTQKVVSEDETGVEIAIKVKLNFELEKEILGFGDGVKVLAPEGLKNRIAAILKNACRKYEE
jgi:predicted DNA-binding transcriptional regulator YafY